ncbi:hypothetical protein EDD22DRAFT_919937 [Suillus occidentalis]|nr:hypothetical protein EDD22DRAFT_919937 [Suillus occidentalis]
MGQFARLSSPAPTSKVESCTRQTLHSAFLRALRRSTKEWNSWSSSLFRFNGTEVEAENFISMGGYINKKFVFTGPDGRSYRWDLQHKLVLSRNETLRTEVARYHRATLGIIGRKREATLEVSPGVVHMMDTIIITFIYVEKLRRETERRSRTIMRQ